MTRTDLCVNKPHKSRSYLNHLVYTHVHCTISLHNLAQLTLLKKKRRVLRIYGILKVFRYEIKGM
jgi:hypothetical protein